MNVVSMADRFFTNIFGALSKTKQTKQQAQVTRQDKEKPFL